MVPPKGESRGLTAMGIFLMFGACMALLASITLTWPGTPLDKSWKLNPQAHARLAPLGRTAGLLFFLLAIALGLSALGWWRRRHWGWLSATFLIAAQVLGDIINAASGNLLHGLVGTTIASALLIYLLRPSVRAAFAPNGKNLVDLLRGKGDGSS
jgi:NADH:ubiquinone oxidoreductase subunit 2 (subunit N)